MARTATAALALTLGLLACGPPKGDVPRDLEAEALRFAEVTCAARETCGCTGDGRYDSRSACEDDLVDRFLAQVDAGLTFDADCFDATLASDAMTCAEWPYETDRPLCPTLQRQGNEGDPCVGHSDLYPLKVTDCMDDLSCTMGVCTRDYATQPEGAPCKDEVVNTCGSGLWCGLDEICHPSVALGEACTNWRGCGLEAYCAGLGADGVGTCSEHLITGDSCDPQDWGACLLPPWSWCGPGEAGGYTCQEGVPGICRLTFPYAI